MAVLVDVFGKSIEVRRVVRERQHAEVYDRAAREIEPEHAVLAGVFPAADDLPSVVDVGNVREQPSAARRQEVVEIAETAGGSPEHGPVAARKNAVDQNVSAGVEA